MASVSTVKVPASSTKGPSIVLLGQLKAGLCKFGAMTEADIKVIWQHAKDPCDGKETHLGKHANYTVAHMTNKFREDGCIPLFFYPRLDNSNKRSLAIHFGISETSTEIQKAIDFFLALQNLWFVLLDKLFAPSEVTQLTTSWKSHHNCAIRFYYALTDTQQSKIHDEICLHHS